METTYQYTLEKYTGRASRFDCPSCLESGKFTRYIDTETGEHLPEQYGKCNRELSCGYHLNPYKDGFHLGNGSYSAGAPKQKAEPIKIYSIDEKYFVESQTNYSGNTFTQFLKDTIGKEKTALAIELYGIGTNDEIFKGAAVFWLRDYSGLLRSAQVIQYDEQGHTVKYVSGTGDVKRCNNWFHNALKRRYQKKGTIPDWLKEYCEAAPKFPCLFGEHLLKHNVKKPVALVESAKTAIIASQYLPQFVWLAVGSLSNLTPERCVSLKGRNVVLFPDLGAFAAWEMKAEKIARLVANLTLYDVLEKNSTEAERQSGFDIADYLVKYTPSEFSPKKQTVPQPEILAPESSQPERQILPTVKAIQETLSQDELETRVTFEESPFYSLSAISNVWQNEIDVLKDFFSSVEFPELPIQLNKCTAIVNPRTFVESHLNFVTAHNGRNGFLPYLERLRELKAFLTIKCEISIIIK